MELETLQVVFAALVVLGVVLVVIALVRALAEAARAVPAIRIPAALGAAVMAFAFMRALVVGVDVQVQMLIGLFEVNLPVKFTNLDLQPDEVRYEMWLREVNPLPGPGCNTSENSCAWADYFSGVAPKSKGPIKARLDSLRSYALPAETGPAIFTAGLMLLITRRGKGKLRRDGLVDVTVTTDAQADLPQPPDDHTRRSGDPGSL